MARVRTKEGSLPSDHPIFRGIHVGPAIRATPPPRDLGLAALNELLADFKDDPEWVVRGERAFTWWGSSHATRIWAEPEIESCGCCLTRLKAETDLVRGARTDPGSDLFLATAARFASLFGVVRDAEEPGALRLQSSVYVSAETAACWLRLFKTAVGLQAEEAVRIAPAIAEEVGGEPARTPHPGSGFREGPGYMLGLSAKLTEKGGKKSAWSGREMRDVLRTFQRPPCLLATGDADGLSAEFPFLGESSLLRLLTTERHPLLGTGLLMILRIPFGAPPDDPASFGLRLNALERDTFTGTQFLGSWCADGESVAYVSFVPSLLHVRGLLTNMTMAMAVRARWIAEAVFKDDWKRVPARSAAERLGEMLERPS